MFAYCNNNPVVRQDSTGTAFETVFDVISLGASIVEVALNPADIWAWAGLAGDVIDLIPFVTGVGEVTRAVNTGRKIVNAADTLNDARKLVDTASDVKKGWKVGENIQNLTKAGNTPSWSAIRSRYWKNKAHFFKNDYSKNDLERMKKGLAPLVEGFDGKMYPMELHHPNGRKGNNLFTFIEVTPWAHAEIDPFRYF